MMKFSFRTVTQGLNLIGLVGVAIVETIRPDTIGAAMNLGLVIFGGAILLILSVRKNPPSATEG